MSRIPIPITIQRDRDSATYYAEHVISLSPTLEQLNNALYILTNDDDSKDKEDIRKTSADRSDTQKLLEIQKGKLSQAAQLLEQDLNKQPDLRWLYAILATIVLIGCSLGIYLRKKQKRHQLLSQQINELEKKNDADILKKRARIENLCRIFSNSQDIKSDLCWNDYHQMCHIVNQNFRM